MSMRMGEKRTRKQSKGGGSFAGDDSDLGLSRVLLGEDGG